MGIRIRAMPDSCRYTNLRTNVFARRNDRDPVCGPRRAMGRPHRNDTERDAPRIHFRWRRIDGLRSLRCQCREIRRCSERHSESAAQIGQSRQAARNRHGLKTRRALRILDRRRIQRERRHVVQRQARQARAGRSRPGASCDHSTRHVQAVDGREQL